MKACHQSYLIPAVLGSSLAAGCADPPPAAELATTLAPLVTAGAAATIDGQYIVVFKGSVADRGGIAAAMSRVQLTSAASRIEHQYSVVPGFSARLTPEDLDAVRRHPEVAYVEQDQLMFAMATRPAGGDLELDRHDHCPALDDSTFDDHGCSGTSALIYVVDSGIRATHAEFRPSRVLALRGFTAIADGRGTDDCDGHGTYVASLAAGRTFGLANGARLIPVRVLGCTGSGSVSGIVAGVDFVRGNCGAAERCVANMSLSGAASATLDSAVAAAINAGIPFTVAAGDSNADAGSLSPGRVAAAVTVGCASDTGYPASDGSRSIVRCTSSNFGPTVDISASGQTVLGADNASDTATQTLSGTSGSAAYVAGAIAQLLGCSATEPTVAQASAILADRALDNVMADGGRLLCSDFSNDGVDACACTSSPPPTPAPDSCQENNLCDGQAPAGCFCDVACEQFNDCCPDGPCTF